MKNILNICMILVVTNLTAKEIEVETPQERTRIHSVKKVIATGGLKEQKDLSVTDSFNNMFKNATVTGQIRFMNSAYHIKNAQDIYATAIGGQLVYELAEYNGISAGVGFVTSKEIGFLSGNDLKYNPELSSSEGHYTEMSKAFINYKYKDLNIRAGRQLIDTPLADSDDIRMVPNTFEAYILNYKLNNFNFMGGNLQQWHGTDAGLTDWLDTGKDGTWFGGITYSDNLINAALWYYDFSTSLESGVGANQSIYFEFGLNHKFNETVFAHIDVQYLNQNESKNSGIESNIYGAFAEIVAFDLGFNIAYNKASKQSNKTSFSGYGGGTLYTNMDNMILDNITNDRDAEAYVVGLSYEINKYKFLYAYAHFLGKRDSANIKEHIVEQNMGVEYNFNKNIALSFLYLLDDNQESVTSSSGINDQDNLRILITYNF